MLSFIKQPARMRWGPRHGAALHSFGGVESLLSLLRSRSSAAPRSAVAVVVKHLLSNYSFDDRGDQLVAAGCVPALLQCLSDADTGSTGRIAACQALHELASSVKHARLTLAAMLEADMATALAGLLGSRSPAVQSAALRLLRV